MSLLSLVKIRKSGIDASIAEALDLIRFNFSNNVKRIVIKSNMCYYWDHSTGQTTSPMFIGALVDLVRKRTSPNSVISVVESDASAMKCRHAFKFLGYENAAKDHTFKLVNLSEEESEPVYTKVGDYSFHINVPQSIKNADLRINATKIKYSLDNVKLTCAMKNIFGCNPYPKKFKYHPYINEVIVAVNKAMKFDLNIVDGNVVTGSGVRRLGLIMASKDPVAVDTVAARIAGINPGTIRYLKLAEKEGLGSNDYTVVGMPINYFKERFPRRSGMKKLMNHSTKLVSVLKLGKRLGIE